MQPIERDEDAAAGPGDRRRVATTIARSRRRDGGVPPPSGRSTRRSGSSTRRDLAGARSTGATTRWPRSRRAARPASASSRRRSTRWSASCASRATSTTPRFAQRFAEDRRRLDGWGAERIERRLRALGVERELIAAAVGEQDRGRRARGGGRAAAPPLPEPPATPRDCERALGMLVRKGYDARAGARRDPPPRRASGLRVSTRLRGRPRRYYDPLKRQAEPSWLMKLQQISNL